MFNKKDELSLEIKEWLEDYRQYGKSSLEQRAYSLFILSNGVANEFKN